MKEGLFFFVAIIGVLAAVYLWGQPKKEGFQAEGDVPPKGASPGLSIPLISPRYQTLAEGEVQPLTPPTATLLAPPPGQTASVNTLPAEDPASEKAPTGRLESLLLSLKGFFQKDAPGLSKIGDPSIQLPMSTAKSDQARLQDEITVLERNPGLQSTLTQQDLDGIEGNLAYLQKKWRQSVNSMSGSPMPPTEGFSDLAPARGWFGGLLGPRSSEGFQTSSGPSGPSGPSSSSSKKSDVKLKDLEDLNLKLSVEILRLQSSGTTDLTVVARINVLTDIQKAVSDLISDVRRGVKREEELPLMKADIAKFLPAMTNPNTELPDLFSMGGLSDVLNSLFPKYGAGDVSGAQVAQQFFDKYGDAIFNNLSWNVGFNYKGKAEQEIAANWAAAMRDAKMAAEWSPSGKGQHAETPGPAPSGPDAGTYGGFFQNVITNLTGGGTNVSVTVDGKPAGVASTGAAGGAGAKPPSRLDWKKRSTDICNQIRARSLPAAEFGCFDDPDKIKQEGFSWRGYARMVCNRLSTVHDPSVPELCGCPPPTWPGWKP